MGSAAAAVRASPTTTYVAGSSGLTPKSKLDISGVNAAASASPHPTPMAPSRRPWRTNIRFRAPGCAPNANRMLISRER